LTKQTGTLRITDLRVTGRLLLGIGTILLAAGGSVHAQESADCLTCHGDRGATGTRRGRTISVFVDEAKFGGSIHGSLSCISCHADLTGKEFPHDEDLALVECGICHVAEEEMHAKSLHGKAIVRGDALAPHCKDCHGTHEILPVKDPRSTVAPLKVPFLCGKCHQEGTPVQRRRVIHQDHILENFSESIHGEGLLKKGLIVAPTCASCHTAHSILPHTDPASSIARRNIATTCAKCHAQIETVHRKVIKGELWEKEAHMLPACVDCHQPHKVRKVFYDQGMADRDCMKCHERLDIRSTVDDRSLTVRADDLIHSRHAKTACSQCHAGVNASHVRPCETITQKVDCASCHAEIGQQYQKSTHGKLIAKNDPNAPTCKECHGTHAVKGRIDPASPTFATNVPGLCARCHREGQKAAARYIGDEHQIIERYTESIHGKGLMKSGLTVTAMCTNCHTAHSVLPRADSLSSVNPRNVPATCGRCHHGIQGQFEQSVHATLAAKSKKELPVCNDCHTAHTIRRADEQGFKLDIMTKCGRCHEEIAKTYFDTYHGKVSQLGYTKTAKCYDCHGAHDILPVSDPRSHLSRENVVTTCQKCHPGATRRFAGYLTHATHHDPKKYPLLFWTFWGMTGLLVVTFVLGGVHTLLWLPRALQMRRQERRKERETPPEGLTVETPDKGEQRQYLRFSRLNRVLHVIMIVSFMSLALTGMTLKFSYTGWAAVMSRAFGGFESAGYIHRLAAVFMIGIFAAHVTDLVRRKRREYGSWKKLLTGPDTMLPTKRDLAEFLGSLKWFLGLGPRPAFGRWTYWEKFDYFAVFWGIFVIGSTGLMLWFPEFFTHLIPGLFINVATIIHSDEALLAVGFIFTVHFFNTHLRPEKFPMDTVIFTGRMELDELRSDKPAEYAELLRSGNLEKNLVEAYPPIVIRTIRAFAWVALTVGFSIVLWIIYAMLFAYR
jgi:cytochrome b subunit of formate dehydrogenase/uncharacterized protein with PIN domain